MSIESESPKHIIFEGRMYEQCREGGHSTSGEVPKVERVGSPCEHELDPTHCPPLSAFECHKCGKDMREVREDFKKLEKVPLHCPCGLPHVPELPPVAKKGMTVENVQEIVDEALLKDWMTFKSNKAFREFCKFIHQAYEERQK